METNKKNIRVSDIIKNDDIEKWKTGDIIIISAGTGKGKSFLIKNSLFSYAKEEMKILMLIHRADCINNLERKLKGIIRAKLH